MQKIFTRLNLFLAVAVLFSNGVDASAQIVAPRDVGYQQVLEPRTLPIITVGPGVGDDTERVQAAIDKASAMRTGAGGRLRGGRVFLRNGRYYLAGVKLKSDVYLRFGRDVVIESRGARRGEESVVFTLASGISNVSVRGRSAEFPVRMVGPEIPTGLDPILRYNAFRLNDVSNFEIANVKVYNGLTFFSTMSMAPEGRDLDGKVPTGGTVENYNCLENPGGFGGIQVHACAGVLFNGISSDGGITLRLETGIESFAGITDVIARDIECTNGRSAISFSPHAVRSHNRIEIQGVRASGCGLAIEAHNGFVDRNSPTQFSQFSQPGRFRNVSISDVVAEFGNEGRAVVNRQQLGLIPTNFLPVLPSNPLDFVDVRRRAGRTLEAIPIGIVLEPSDYSIGLDRGSVVGIGFPAEVSPLIVNPSTPDRNPNVRSLRAELFALLNALAAMGVVAD